MTYTLQASEAYCQQLTKQSGSSFYHSFRFLPERERKGMFALYAFCREVDDVVDENLSETKARKELDEWRDHVEKLYRGESDNKVMIAMEDTLSFANIQKNHLHELIDGMEMDLDQQRYASIKELRLYCYRVASVVGLMTIEIFGYQNRKTQQYAHDLGLAFQYTNILRDVKEDAQRGRIYLPQDELERFKVPEQHLHMDTTSPEARNLFRHHAKRAEDHYAKAFSQLPEEDRYKQRSGLIMSAVYHKILEEIEQTDYTILEGNGNISKLNKIWTAWRCASSEKKRYEKYLKTATS